MHCKASIECIAIFYTVLVDLLGTQQRAVNQIVGKKMQNKLKIILINECFIFNLVKRGWIFKADFLEKNNKNPKDDWQNKQI